MAQLIPYLNFNGNCREAMTFYKTCLGGELMVQKISESPMAAHKPSEMAAMILHSQLTSKSGFILRGSDMMGKNLVKGNSIGLCLDCPTEKETTTIFTKLSVDGHVKMPLHQTFWGATYGELTDKFGVNWMLNYSKS